MSIQLCKHASPVSPRVVPWEGASEPDSQSFPWTSLPPTPRPQPPLWPPEPKNTGGQKSPRLLGELRSRPLLPHFSLGCAGLASPSPSPQPTTTVPVGVIPAHQRVPMRVRTRQVSLRPPPQPRGTGWEVGSSARHCRLPAGTSESRAGAGEGAWHRGGWVIGALTVILCRRRRRRLAGAFCSGHHPPLNSPLGLLWSHGRTAHSLTSGKIRVRRAFQISISLLAARRALRPTRRPGASRPGEPGRQRNREGWNHGMKKCIRKLRNTMQRIA